MIWLLIENALDPEKEWTKYHTALTMFYFTISIVLIVFMEDLQKVMHDVRVN